DESEEVEPEPPPVAVRRKVSFADAFGLDLVSVKEYDKQDLLTDRVGEEFYISCLFNITDFNHNMEERLQQQKLELEKFELLPGSTSIQGTIRVLNLCFHKTVYVRTSLDGWQSNFDLLAQYVPGSSDGRTDCFSFYLVLVPPFPPEGLRVEFCLRYETNVGTFWANNGGMNYVVFCHQRGRINLKEQEENVIPKEGNARDKTGEVAGVTSCKSLQDCCKTLVDRRRKRQAARLAQIQDYFAQKKIETQIGPNSIKDEINKSIPRLDIQSRTVKTQGFDNDPPTMPMYHQIPLVTLNWASSPPQAKLLDSKNESTRKVKDDLSIARCKPWEVFLKGDDVAPQKVIAGCKDSHLRDQVAGPIDLKRAMTDDSEGSADRKAYDMVKSDPKDYPRNLSKSQSSDHDYQLETEPAVPCVPCFSLGTMAERMESVLEQSCDCQDVAETTPAQTLHDNKTHKSEAEDGISPEERSDTSKFKENTHRPVSETLTFEGIRNVSLTNRQAEGSSSQKKDINREDSKGQVDLRQFCAAFHEEDKEGNRKGHDETSTDHSTEVHSVHSERMGFQGNKLTRSNTNVSRDYCEEQKGTERWFELNEGLTICQQMNETAGKESEETAMCSETQQELTDALHDVGRNGDETEFLSVVTASSHEQDSALGETLQAHLIYGGDELSTASHGSQLTWLRHDIRNRFVLWWQELNSFGRMTKAVICAILLVVFIYV
ncbi:hypothetical protein DNTS_013840, partial [Danionella cerebrum]